jgi:IS5 family transposase
VIITAEIRSASHDTPKCRCSTRQAGQVRLQAQLVDNDDGVVVDHTIEPLNPGDAPRLAPGIERIIKRTGRKPRTVTADRGYGEPSVEDSLRQMGVRTVVIPARAAQQGQTCLGTPWGIPENGEMAAGSEGRISALKRGYGWDRTRIDSTEGARIWTGHGVLAHNLAKISPLDA